MRPPRLVSPVPRVTFRWWRAWTRHWYDVAMPAVLRSMWRAPDGSLGLVLYNISPKAQPVRIALDDPEYGLTGRARIVLNRVYPAGGDLQPRDLVLSYTVPGRSPAVLEIGP